MPSAPHKSAVGKRKQCRGYHLTTGPVHSIALAVLDISVPLLLEPGTLTATLDPHRNWGARISQKLMLKQLPQVFRSAAPTSPGSTTAQ